MTSRYFVIQFGVHKKIASRTVRYSYSWINFKLSYLYLFLKAKYFHLFPIGGFSMTNWLCFVSPQIVMWKNLLSEKKAIEFASFPVEKLRTGEHRYLDWKIEGKSSQISIRDNLRVVLLYIRDVLVCFRVIALFISGLNFTIFLFRRVQHKLHDTWRMSPCTFASSSIRSCSS